MMWYSILQYINQSELALYLLMQMEAAVKVGYAAY